MCEAHIEQDLKQGRWCRWHRFLWHLAGNAL